MATRCAGCGIEYAIAQMFYPLAITPEDQAARTLSEKKEVLFCGACFREHLKGLSPAVLAEVVVGLMQQVNNQEEDIRRIRNGSMQQRDEYQRLLERTAIAKSGITRSDLGWGKMSAKDVSELLEGR